MHHLVSKSVVFCQKSNHTFTALAAVLTTYVTKTMSLIYIILRASRIADSRLLRTNDLLQKGLETLEVVQELVCLLRDQLFIFVLCTCFVVGAWLLLGVWIIERSFILDPCE